MHDFFHSKHLGQFEFYMNPKTLYHVWEYAQMSFGARALYSILLSRMELSRKNGWVDDNDNVYLCYRISDIAQDLFITEKKAMEFIGELKDHDLVLKKRQGIGLPDVIYLKDLNSEIDDPSTAENGSTVLPKSEVPYSQNQQYSTPKIGSTVLPKSEFLYNVYIERDKIERDKINRVEINNNLLSPDGNDALSRAIALCSFQGRDDSDDDSTASF